jgi:DNA-binding CsgD family transcriptional regulator
MPDGSISVMLGIHRRMGSPPLDHDEFAICKRLATHLTEALKIHRASIRMHQERRIGMELLARLRVPVVVLDERRRIHQLNPSAERLLAGDGRLLVQNAGHLFCHRPADDASLLIGLRELLRDGPGLRNGRSSDRIFLRIGEPAGSGFLGLFLHALRPSETMCAFGNEPLAMVLLHDPADTPALDPLLVAAAYDLTPAEARVAVAMAQGSSPALIAGERGVSINTIRTQLQIVFQKTSTTRQGELVSLLAGFQMAARGFGEP